MNAIHRCIEGEAAEGIFIVRRMSEAEWLVSSPCHRCGGFFRSMDEAWRFARAEARCRRHGEVIVLGDSCVDIERFDEARKTATFHFDGPGAPLEGGAA